ncbi:hypothetical protein AVEN_140909-1 [Araneus ventricosus]|uniref:Secreted protein n=1 Tax=Araneus ventricosus TaxID=182803 RepID=A0A4Y2JNI8_ARAVE|nr:hypothetical protein AVEN_140909-1 [Araneus ventricosus]
MWMHGTKSATWIQIILTLVVELSRELLYSHSAAQCRFEYDCPQNPSHELKWTKKKCVNVYSTCPLSFVLCGSATFVAARNGMRRHFVLVANDDFDEVGLRMRGN